MKILAKAIIFILQCTRPLNHIILGPGCCKFAISCTDYAYEQLNKRPLLPALWAILRRVLSCNPFTKM